MFARTPRRLLALAALMLTLGVFSPPAALTTQAATAQQFEWTYYYYSDATYTTMVGYWHDACNNAYDYSWGVQTQYYRYGYGPCGIDPEID
ncbi:MAG TPA: DUF6289 family protein [Herpetosiphonaceae bacterium]